jgi:hypothetical protein
VESFVFEKIIDKGDDRMNKDRLFKKLKSVHRGNFFLIEIPIATKEDGKKVEELAVELERDGKIKLRELVQREYSVYLHGILKYVSSH